VGPGCLSATQYNYILPENSNFHATSNELIEMIKIKNSIYGVIDALISPVLMLLATPIFLSYLGVEGYAIWVLVNSVIASLAIFNLGGSEVAIKFISSCRNDRNKDDAGEIFSTIFLFQSIVVLIIYILFLIFAPIVNKIIISTDFLTIVNILYIAIPVFFVKQSEEMLYAFFKGYEQFGHVVIISTISKILFFSTQILIAIFTESVVNVFYGALIVSVLLFLLQVIYIKRVHESNISFSKASIKTAKSLLNFSTWNGLASLVAMLRSQSDKWIVSGLLGLKTFGFYSIGVLVFNQLYNIVGSSIYWVFPEISKENFNKKYLASKYWKLLFLVCTVSLAISFTLVNLDFLFQLWLGEEVFKSSKYYINIFLLLFPVFALSTVSSLYLLGLGLAKYEFFVSVVSFFSKVIVILVVINIFNFKDWVIFFLLFMVVEFTAYAIIISKNLPIKLAYLMVFLLLQVLIVFVRV